MDDWLPFREMFTHTRELPIKSSQLQLIPAGLVSFGGGDVLYYLVIDGWNNRRAYEY